MIEHREQATKRSCHTVVTESNHARSDLIEKRDFQQARIDVIRAWLPQEFIAPIPQESIAKTRSRYRLPKRYWLYVGGYDVRKNVEMLLRCYAAVRKQKKAPPLVLAGRIPKNMSKPICDVYGTIANLSLSKEDVQLPGFIDAKHLPAVYAGAELFVYPSLYEGFGLPPMEAMGCGCPTIVTDSTSLPEVVTDQEYRFAVDQPHSLTELLLRATDSPLTLNPGFSLAQFSQETAAEAYTALFKEITCK